ncbi:unnamed protein product [Closterium sp. NIES-64]|nr:unnamed protein product [Closterium sp. NIES-64]
MRLHCDRGGPPPGVVILGVRTLGVLVHGLLSLGVLVLGVLTLGVPVLGVLTLGVLRVLVVVESWVLLLGVLVLDSSSNLVRRPSRRSSFAIGLFGKAVLVVEVMVLQVLEVLELLVLEVLELEVLEVLELLVLEVLELEVLEVLELLVLEVLELEVLEVLELLVLEVLELEVLEVLELLVLEVLELLVLEILELEVLEVLELLVLEVLELEVLKVLELLVLEVLELLVLEVLELLVLEVLEVLELLVLEVLKLEVLEVLELVVLEVLELEVLGLLQLLSRVALPSPPASSLPDVPGPESDLARVAHPTVTRLLATIVTNPSFESTVASALVTELVDFAAIRRLDYVASLITESESVCPPSVEGELALGCDVLEDRQFELECLAAVIPRFASMLLCPEGDPDALDIPTTRTHAEAITGEYSSRWQIAMDAEMASWKSTGTYVDEVPPLGANIVDDMWIFRVKRPPGFPPIFKACYVAQGFSQRQGVDLFQTFSPTPKMTTLRVILHVAAQRDYKLHSLDFSTTFLHGSLHKEIWLCRPPGFTGSFPKGT